MESAQSEPPASDVKSESIPDPIETSLNPDVNPAQTSEELTNGDTATAAPVGLDPVGASFADRHVDGTPAQEWSDSDIAATVETEIVENPLSNGDENRANAGENETKTNHGSEGEVNK